MRAERNHYRQRALNLGSNVQTIFLDVPIETLHERVAHRNLNLPPGTFNVSVEEHDEWAALFEPPTPEETTKPGLRRALTKVERKTASSERSNTTGLAPRQLVHRHHLHPGVTIGLLDRRVFDRDAGHLERMPARRRADRPLFRWRSILVRRRSNHLCRPLLSGQPTGPNRALRNGAGAQPVGMTGCTFKM